MNDEEFARSLFSHVFESGTTGEPPTLPSLDRIAARGRQATRTRQGVYAASTAALAGVVTAGVVTGPSLLGLRGGSNNVSSGGQGSGSITGSASATPSGPVAVKSKTVTPCATPPTVDWSTVIKPHLPPRTTLAIEPKALARKGTTCLMLSDGSMSTETLFTLTNPDGVLQVDVTTGPAGTGAASAAVNPSSLSQQDLSKLQAQKSAQAHNQESQDQSKAALASKLAAAGAATGTSASAGVGKIDRPAVAPTPTCSVVNAPDAEQLCTSAVTKGGYNGVDVSLTRKSPTPLQIEVVASTAQPNGTGSAAQPPLDAAQLTAIAQAVAAQY
ncbi:MAG: hypothetical protein ACRDV3_09985 [Acidothermaceae bacterium]